SQLTTPRPSPGGGAEDTAAGGGHPPGVFFSPPGRPQPRQYPIGNPMARLARVLAYDDPQLLCIFRKIVAQSSTNEERAFQSKWELAGDATNAVRSKELSHGTGHLTGEVSVVRPRGNLYP